jgi:DNA-binding CsgD family transcriptional regulator
MDCKSDYFAQDLMVKLAAATTVKETWSGFMAAMSSIGLEAGMLVYSPGGEVERNRFFTYSDYSEGFNRDYINLGGAVNDLTVQLALQEFWRYRHHRIDGVALAEWRDIDKMVAENPHFVEDRHLAIEELSRDYKVERGFSCLLPSPIQVNTLDVATSGLGLSAPGISDADFDGAIMPRQKDITSAIKLLRINLKRFSYAETASMFTQELPQLSRRESTLIRHLADGLRVKQIAGELIPRSEDQLNKDIRTLKKKLNANTMDEMVMVALMLGMC